MIKTIEKELRDWLHPVSPLTAYAKTLRCETSASDDAASAKGKVVGEDDDPFADLDLDELPADVRKSIEAAKKGLGVAKTAATEAETRRKKAEDFARTQQSEASRAKHLLKHHNISLDGTQQQQQTGTDPLEARIERIMRDHKLERGPAEQYAKMLAADAEQTKHEIMQQFGPLVGVVGDLQASGHVATARIEHSKYFAVPEISKMVEDNVAAMVKGGHPVSKESVDHLVKMAVGEIAITNPDLLGKTKTSTTEHQQVPQTQQIPRFGQTISTGAHVPQQKDTDNNAPRATQPETAAIMTRINEQFRVGMPAKKGGK